MLKYILFAIIISCNISSFALTGLEIIKKVDTYRVHDFDTSFTVEVQDIKAGKVQKTKYKVFNKGAKMSRVETIFPERQAGRKMLMKGDDLWLFTPDIKRPTRISMQQRLTGEVANGDIVRTNMAEDYDSVVKGEEKSEGQDTIHLTLKKKRSEVTYPAMDFWASKNGYAPVRADFKTEGGKNLKTALYTEPKKILGQTIYTKIEIINALNKTQKSILIFSDYKKEKLDESFFNKESLNN